MSAICRVRVDDRLIHGQVTVGWRQYLGYDGLWVVDDGVGQDPFLGDVLRLAAPSGVEVQVHTVQEAIAAWARLRSEGGGEGGAETAPRARKILLLVKHPETALKLFEEGMDQPLRERGLNVGNLAAKPGSRRAFQSISLTPEDVSALDALAQRGVRITFQPVPHGAEADWTALRSRFVRDASSRP